MVIKYITYFNSVALFIFIVGNINNFLRTLVFINIFLGVLILINIGDYESCMFVIDNFKVCKFKTYKVCKFKPYKHQSYRYITTTTNTVVKGSVKGVKEFDSVDVYDFTNEGIFTRLENESVLKLNISKDVKKLFRKLNISNTEHERLALLLPSLGYVTRYRNSRYPSSRFTISV